MKKIRLFVPILMAVATLFAPMQASAAEQKLDAGTKSATVTMTLNELQSFEGVFSCTATDKKATITLKSVTATCNDSSAMCSVSENRIFMVSTGKSVNTTIKLELEFSKDGKYQVKLDGGQTDKNGKYKEKVETLKILVGVVEETEDKEEEEKDTNKTTKKDTSDSEKKTTTTKKIKKTKKGVSEIDIKPHIKLMSTSPLEDGKIKIRALFTAGIMFNINPTLLITAFGAHLNKPITVNSVVKKRVLTQDNEDFR